VALQSGWLRGCAKGLRRLPGIDGIDHGFSFPLKEAAYTYSEETKTVNPLDAPMMEDVLF